MSPAAFLLHAAVPPSVKQWVSFVLSGLISSAGYSPWPCPRLLITNITNLKTSLSRHKHQQPGHTWAAAIITWWPSLRHVMMWCHLMSWYQSTITADVDISYLLVCTLTRRALKDIKCDQYLSDVSKCSNVVRAVCASPEAVSRGEAAAACYCLPSFDWVLISDGNQMRGPMRERRRDNQACAV